MSVLWKASGYADEITSQSVTLCEFQIVRLVAMEMIVSRRAEIVRSVPVTLRLDSVMGDVLRGGKGLGVNQVSV